MSGLPHWISQWFFPVRLAGIGTAGIKHLYKHQRPVQELRSGCILVVSHVAMLHLPRRLLVVLLLILLVIVRPPHKPALSTGKAQATAPSLRDSPAQEIPIPQATRTYFSGLLGAGQLLLQVPPTSTPRGGSGGMRQGWQGRGCAWGGGPGVRPGVRPGVAGQG